MTTSSPDSTSLPPKFPHDGVDAVDLGDCVLFMATDDKFYRGCVGESNRHIKIESAHPLLSLSYHRPSAVSDRTIETITDAKYGMYLVFHHLISRKLHPIYLDTTSGSVHACIRYGNFFRTMKCDSRAYVFDSSTFSDIVLHSITLNGLEAQVCPVTPGDTIASIISADTTQCAFVNVNSLGALSEFQDLITSKASVVTFETHAGNKDALETLSALLETHILFDVGFAYRPFCFAPITTRDLKQFLRIVAHYPHRATHVLAMSRAIPEVNELAYQLACLTPGPVEYSLVMETPPPIERAKSRLAEQVEVIVMAPRTPPLPPVESPFLSDIPVAQMAHETRLISRLTAL